ncbi:hypothetical protein [Pseudomonas entomophila]|uniref:Uncharacterized protein n=1 Tax=Pseudomonas entomophila TaxID=312306 RepID=A0ABY9QL02_9PSED|nr:hypothetical protein [Pseudomonas entomophila]WMW04019.1 hypothetical protein RAH46_16965 [Pseudomonas entomophila]
MAVAPLRKNSARPPEVAFGGAWTIAHQDQKPGEALRARRSKEQRAKSKEQRAKSKEQRAKSKEQRAKSKEQRAKSKELDSYVMLQ